MDEGSEFQQMLVKKTSVEKKVSSEAEHWYLYISEMNVSLLTGHLLRFHCDDDQKVSHYEGGLARVFLSSWLFRYLCV